MKKPKSNKVKRCGAKHLCDQDMCCDDDIDDVKPKQKVKKKVHRHKWVEDMCDCPFCEGPHKSCDCGLVKLIR